MNYKLKVNLFVSFLKQENNLERINEAIYLIDLKIEVQFFFNYNSNTNNLMI